MGLYLGCNPGFVYHSFNSFDVPNCLNDIHYSSHFPPPTTPLPLLLSPLPPSLMVFFLSAGDESSRCGRQASLQEG